jgi:hypothetical protein
VDHEQGLNKVENVKLNDGKKGTCQFQSKRTQKKELQKRHIKLKESILCQQE